ncbi:hypothetical protein RhiirA4_423524 [Rhizophagus irregularis]|uniref:Uncharacterized protein n=1 Tax=Rhizophagus irregularis TaxID=588596 RepID=A0A2I1GUD0_9GLOM|nr:hypothetical protein RhiirA4_423524 [Rhizophagus irregularis]
MDEKKEEKETKSLKNDSSVLWTQHLVFFRISGREIGKFFLGFWAKVFFGSLGGMKICFYLMAYGSFQLLDLLTLNFGYEVGNFTFLLSFFLIFFSLFKFQAIWTLKMGYLGIDGKIKNLKMILP